MSPPPLPYRHRRASASPGRPVAPETVTRRRNGSARELLRQLANGRARICAAGFATRFYRGSAAPHRKPEKKPDGLIMKYRFLFATFLVFPGVLTGRVA